MNQSEATLQALEALGTYRIVDRRTIQEMQSHVLLKTGSGGFSQEHFTLDYKPSQRPSYKVIKYIVAGEVTGWHLAYL